jgi:hypothetical protein
MIGEEMPSLMVIAACPEVNGCPAILTPGMPMVDASVVP